MKSLLNFGLVTSLIIFNFSSLWIISRMLTSSLIFRLHLFHLQLQFQLIRDVISNVRHFVILMAILNLNISDDYRMSTEKDTVNIFVGVSSTDIFNLFFTVCIVSWSFRLIREFIQFCHLLICKAHSVWNDIRCASKVYRRFYRSQFLVSVMI